MIDLKKGKTQLAIRMEQEFIDDFNKRVGEIIDAINATLPNDVKKVRKNQAYFTILELGLSLFEGATLTKKTSYLKKYLEKMIYADYKRG